MECNLGSLYTWGWETQVMWLVEMSEMVQVHYISNLEGMHDQRISNGWKYTWRLTWHQVGIILGFIGFVLGPSKWVKPNSKLRNVGGIIGSWKKKSWWGCKPEHMLVPQHDPLSLYTNLEGPSIPNLVLYFLWYNLPDDFSRALRVSMITALDLCLKRPSLARPNAKRNKTWNKATFI